MNFIKVILCFCIFNVYGAIPIDYLNNSLTNTIYDYDRVGNGGDAIICRDSEGQILSARLLDFFEGELLRNLKMDNEDFTGKSYLEIAESLLDRTRGLDELVYNKTKPWLDRFIDEMQLIENSELTDIEDSEHLALPSGCELQQLAIQVTPTTSLDKRYLIQSEIWNKLNDFNKAGLVIHELIYRNLIEKRAASNSFYVRYLVSLLGANKLEALTQDSYDELIKDRLLFSKSKPAMLINELMTKKWSASELVPYNDRVLKIDYSLEFLSVGVLKYSVACHFDKISLGALAKASVESQVRISQNAKYIVFEEDSYEENLNTFSHGCFAATSKGPSSVRIDDNGSLYFLSKKWVPLLI